MSRAMSFLRIEKETSSQLNLISKDRRWLLLISALAFTMPLVCLGALLLTQEENGPFGAAGIFFGLSILILILLFTPFKSQLIINSSLRTITINLHYWLGLGSLERTREKAWSFNEITDANLALQGWKKLVELESNGKKVLLLDFGRKAADAQRSYDVLQSWLKGLVPDSSAATTALQELASEKQSQQILKNAEKLLYFFGVFSLIDSALGLYTDSMPNSSISTLTMIKFLTGMIYLACGYGVKRRIEPALWVAILVVIAERLYWFIISGSLSGDGNWASWLTWVFAVFIVSSLWQAIRSIRVMEKEPAYEPLA